MARVWSEKYGCLVEECWDSERKYRRFTKAELRTAKIHIHKGTYRLLLDNGESHPISRKQYSWMQGIVSRVII